MLTAQTTTPTPLSFDAVRWLVIAAAGGVVVIGLVIFWHARSSALAAAVTA